MTSKRARTLRHYLVEIEKLRQTLTVNYIYPLDKMNSECLLERFQTKVCRLLAYAGHCFIAQIEARQYTNHQANIDLIALHGNDIIKAPLPQELKAFLAMYKKANKLHSIPSPTVEHTITDALHEINGTHERSQVIGDKPDILQDTATPSTVSLTTNTTVTNTPGNSTISTLTSDGNPTLPPPGTMPVIPTVTTPDDNWTIPPPITRPVIPPVANPYHRSPHNHPTHQSLLEPFITAAETTQVLHPYTNVTDDSLNQNQTQDAAYCNFDLDGVIQDNAKQKVRRALLDLLTNTIMTPIQEFERATARKDEYARLIIATAPTHLANMADRISAVITAEPPAERPVLKGLIKECAAASTADLRARVQSIEAKYQQQFESQRLNVPRNQPKRHTTTITTPKPPNPQPRGTPAKKPRWEPPQKPNNKVIDNEVYVDKTVKNSHGSRNLTWSRTTPTHTPVRLAAADSPSTTRPTRQPYAQQPTLHNHHHRRPYHSLVQPANDTNKHQPHHHRRPYHSVAQPDGDTNKKRGRYVNNN